MNDLKILCPFCNEVWDGKMTAQFNYSMGSEWTGIYGEEVKVEIFCTNCKKLIYTKNDSDNDFNVDFPSKI